MKRSIANAVMLAAVSAGTTWIVNLWLEHHRSRRHVAARGELKSQLKTWEEEGGALKPPVPAQDAMSR